MARVLMFSGGMDSFILKQIFQIPNKECLFVRFGTKENITEERFLDKHFPGVHKVDLPLVGFELDNKIIPFRNHFLALVGMQFANEIYFAFTAGDTTRDKDFVFKSQMEGVANYFSLSEDKVRWPWPYLVHLPFKMQTKTQIVAEYLKQGYPPGDLLEKSVSCYNGSSNGCGHCRSCIRKFVALKLNDIDWTEPSRATLQLFLNESIQKGRQNEIEEIKQCINLL